MRTLENIRYYNLPVLGELVFEGSTAGGTNYQYGTRLFKTRQLEYLNLPVMVPSISSAKLFLLVAEWYRSSAKLIQDNQVIAAVATKKELTKLEEVVNELILKQITGVNFLPVGELSVPLYFSNNYTGGINLLKLEVELDAD